VTRRCASRTRGLRDRRVVPMLKDKAELAYLNQQPTSFVLPPEAVRSALRKAAGTIIMDSPEFQRPAEGRWREGPCRSIHGRERGRHANSLSSPAANWAAKPHTRGRSEAVRAASRASHKTHHWETRWNRMRNEFCCRHS